MTRRVFRVLLLSLVVLSVVLLVVPAVRVLLAYLNPAALLGLLVLVTAVLSLVLASAVADSVGISRWPFVQRQLWPAALSPAVFLVALVGVLLLLGGTGAAQPVALIVFGPWTWWLFRSLRRRAVADRDSAGVLSRSAEPVV